MPGTRSKQRGAPSTNVGTPVEEQRSDQATPKTPGALLGEKRLVAAAESNHMQRARARPDSGSNIGPESDSDASTPEVSHLREVTGGSSPFFLASAEEGLERELRAQKEGQASTYGSAHELVTRPKALHDMYAERLDVFLKGVRAIRDHNEVVPPQRLRALLDVPEPNTGSFLILAVKQRKLDAIRVLTGNHETLKIIDSNGNAVAMADPNARGQLGRTALYEACSWGDADAVRMLLGYQQGWSLPFASESGIGPLPLHLGLCDNTGTSPLMVAVQERHASVVALLTNAATAKPHPNVAVSLRAKPTPFTHSAASSVGNSNTPSTPALVLPSGSSTGRGGGVVNAQNDSGLTALSMACNMEVDNLDIVQHLLQAQADVGLADKKGMSPLHYACQRRHALLLPLLLQQSAFVNAKDSVDERSPLHYATDHYAPSAAMVNTLLAANADIRIRDKEGNTPLHLLFLKRRDLLRESRSSKQNKSSALEETVNLILTRAKEQKGADFVARLLSLTNNAGKVCFGPEDKRLHFEHMQASLEKAANVTKTIGSEAVDDELFQDILTQESVKAKWTDTCRAARMCEGLMFFALLVAFSIVVVLRAGAGGQGTAVQSSLRSIFLNGRFSSDATQQFIEPGSLLRDNNDNNACKYSSVMSSLQQGVPFTEVASAEEALEYFARILSDMSEARKVDSHTAAAASVATPAQFSSRAVGVILGAPILKQWRVVNDRDNSGSSGSSDDGTPAELCVMSPKLVSRPPCPHGYASNSRLVDLPAHLPHASVLAPAYSWREWPGDLPWKVSKGEEYPAGAYSLELPLPDAADERSRRERSNQEKGYENEVDASTLVRELATHGWIDSATRGLSLEVAFYNPHPLRDRLSAVQLLVEIRDGIGVRTAHRLRTHKINDYLMWIFENGVAAIITCMILHDLFNKCRLHYKDTDRAKLLTRTYLWGASCLLLALAGVIFDFTNGIFTCAWAACCLLLALAGLVFGFNNGCIAVIRPREVERLLKLNLDIERLLKLMLDISCLCLWAYILFKESEVWIAVNAITWGPTQQYTSVQNLVAQISHQDFGIALMMLTLTIKLVTSKLHAFGNITILLKAIWHSMIFTLASFFVVLIITYCTVGGAKFLVSPNSVGYLDAIIGEFWASVDEGAKSKISDNQSEYANSLLWWLDVGRVVVVTMVLMNIITTMLTESYSRVKDKAEASLCKEQVIMIYEDEIEKRSADAAAAKEKAEAAAAAADNGAATSGSGDENGGSSLSSLEVRSIPALAKHFTLSALDENIFNQAVNDVIPELAFFVGDMRTLDGHEHNDQIAEKITYTFQGLWRCMACNSSTLDDDKFIVDDNKMPLDHNDDAFAELKRFICKVGLEQPVVIEAMLACLVYDQLGKVQLWRAELKQAFKSKNFYESIADQRVLLQALKDESRFRFLPSFTSLQGEAQSLIEEAYEADFIFGQIGQLECVPASLSRLEKIAEKENGKQKILFNLLMQLLGIVGLPSFKGKLPLSNWRMFYKQICAIERLADGRKKHDPAKVYDDLTQDAREDMQADENVNFSECSHPLQKALLRLSRMLRSTKTNKNKFDPLIDAALDLSDNERGRLVDELNRTGINDGWAILLMHSPKLLQNVQKDETTSDSEMQRLRVGLKAIVKLYDKARETLSENSGRKSPKSGIYEVDCYHVSTWAKSTVRLQKITEDWDRYTTMEHSRLMGNLGEATVIVKPMMS